MLVRCRCCTCDRFSQIACIVPKWLSLLHLEKHFLLSEILLLRRGAGLLRVLGLIRWLGHLMLHLVLLNFLHQEDLLVFGELVVR